MTYKHYDEEVYNTIDGSRYDLYKVAICTLARSSSVPKVVDRLTSRMISIKRRFGLEQSFTIGISLSTEIPRSSLARRQ